jgi:uncharacterized damage-inducible protein DinB
MAGSLERHEPRATGSRVRPAGTALFTKTETHTMDATQAPHNASGLLDLHERVHRNLSGLLAHCRGLSEEELNRELPGFGYPTVRLQLHHEIGAAKYWIGVLQGRIDVEEDDPRYPTVTSLEAYREEVYALTESYLRAASVAELNTPRPMMTWGNREHVLIPAHVVVRTLTHLYHHQGQILAMCRLMGKPCSGLDYPIK